MRIEKNRIFIYLISSLFLTSFIICIPAPQPIKYTLFIFIHFFFIVLPVNKKILKSKFLLNSIIFIIAIILINIFSTKFSFTIISFNNLNNNELSTKASSFYNDNYKFCFNNNDECFGKSRSSIKAQSIFYRNYLNINNLNELRSNLFHSPNNAMIHQNEHINKNNYPFILQLKFPKIYYGSKICFSNLELEQKCDLISSENNSFEIIGKGEKNKIFLKQNFNIIFAKFFISIILISFLIGIIRSLYQLKIIDKFELLYPISLLLILTIISLTNIENINFINSYFYQYPGGDGHLYLIMANLIAESAKNFDIYETLRGGRDVFYYMPGMRYFVALEKLIYGNGYYLHLIILSFLPFILRKLLSIYFSKKVVLILMFSFLFFPLMHHMGFSYFQFFRYFTKVFAEPIAYTIFLFAFLRLVYWFKDPDDTYETLPITCLLFTVSCVLRPNLSSSSFFLLIIPLFYLLKNHNYKILFFYFLSGSFIFLPLIHNIYYGQKIILFTEAVFSDANIKINIKDYLNLLMFQDIGIEKKTMLIEMLDNFINPFEVHKYFILLTLVISINFNNLKNVILTPLYILVFSQFFLFFFLNPGPRYMWIFWISSLILSLKIFINYREKKS